MSVFIITTGGTIGARPYKNPRHPPEISSMPTEGRDAVRDALTLNFDSIKTRCHSMEPRDSKLIDEQYREALLDLVKRAPESSILITHGTDTILYTAYFFYRKFAKSKTLQGKKIILTGAMTPLSNGKSSDGYRNLEFALDHLNNNSAALPNTSIVLCDFNREKEWAPCLYPYRPGAYTKVYNKLDGRYHHLQSLVSKSPT